MTFTLDSSSLDVGVIEPAPRAYVRPYTLGFQNGSAGATPVTAAALNTIDAGIASAYNRWRVIASAADMPASPNKGDVVYRTDLHELLVYRGSTWGPMTPEGSVVQTVLLRSDSRTTYSSATSGDGTTVSELNLTITPTYANSHVWCSWLIFGEFHQDNVFLVHKNGSLQSDGYNTSIGNIRSSGVMSAFYDQDQNSTPSNWRLHYVDTSLGSTDTRTYAPAVRGSGATAYTFAFNRTLNGATSNNYETGVSFGWAVEIAR